jgi:ABC-type transport system involved in cytochrome bd biosynthesis fused ATPase/permease subunit
VLDALERASEGRTVLSISHRTEARASGGRIIAVGEEN